MHRTIEVILHPDGTIEPLEALDSPTPRRALLTILDEVPVLPTAAPPDNDDEVIQIDAILRAAGLLVVPDDIPEHLHPLSDAERAALARRIPPGTPLAQIIIDERDESF